MRSKNNGFWILLFSLPLLAWIVYPVLAMLWESVTLSIAPYRAKSMGWDSAHQPIGAPLRRVFTEPATREAIWGTLWISILSAVSACVWGTALALLWWRQEFPFRRFFATLGYAPLLMPPMVGTLAFFRLIGEGGLLWQGLGSSGRPLLDGFWLVLILHTYSFGVYTYAYVSAALNGADLSREEAARSLGAGTLRTFWTTVRPLIMPPLLASALLTLMSSAASFSAPYILDNASRYLTVEIGNESGDTGMQRALTVVLATLSLATLPFFLWITHQGKINPEAAYSLKGAARRSLPKCSKRTASLRGILSILAALILIAPPALVIIAALAPTLIGINTSGSPESPQGLFASLTTSDLASLGRSATYASIASCIDIALALMIAVSLRKSSLLSSLALEFPVMLALALPGSAIAIALLCAFNAPSWLTMGIPLGNTAAILVLAYTVRHLPLAVRPVRAAFSNLGTDMEKAAAGLGARGISVYLRIVLPLILPSLLAAFLICFVNAVGEFAASSLLYSVRTQPVSVRINEIYRIYSAQAYALSLCLMALSAAAIGAAAWIQHKWMR